MHTQINVAPNLKGFDIFNLIFDRSISQCFSANLGNNLRGKNIIFGKSERKLLPINGWGNTSNEYCKTAIKPIQPIKEDTIICAIDSSCIRLGDTEEGALYATKSGVAIAIGGQIQRHYKLGPVLFYLSEDTLKHADLDHRVARLSLNDDESAKRLIRISVERSIQFELSCDFVNAVILVDGSLKSSIFESRKHSINKVAENCSLNNNTLVGISKSTKLKILDRISLPLIKANGPAFMEIDLIIKSLVRNTLGDNLLVKLGNNNTIPILRADIITNGDNNKSLGKLLGNDSIAGGYPETLKLAHHISNFNNTEASCLKSHVLNSYDVTELESEDIRQRLLGSIPI